MSVFSAAGWLSELCSGDDGSELRRFHGERAAGWVGVYGVLCGLRSHFSVGAITGARVAQFVSLG